MRVVALAGGVGGAKLADGLAQVLAGEALTVVVNIGDDFEHLGLWISPDLDTVVYTLAGVANPETGWGRAEETWTFLHTVGELGGPDWFRLGDRDVALHVLRTQRLRTGDRLSEITWDVCEALGVGPRVLPASDDRVPTIIKSEDVEMSFQEYFVARRCEPRVTGFRFEGIDRARPAPGVLDAILGADTVVLCPSNPWVSLDPILSIPGVRKAVLERPVVGVSPIIGGRTVKGPAAKMYAEMGIEPSAAAVARHYADLLRGMVIDSEDASLAGEIQSEGIRVSVTQTLMTERGHRPRLAAEVLSLAAQLTGAKVTP